MELRGLWQRISSLRCAWERSSSWMTSTPTSPSDGGAAATAEAVGTAARGIGQIFKEGKNDALACGFNPEAVLQIQGKDMPWAEAVKGLGVWVEKNLNFEKHIAQKKDPCSQTKHLIRKVQILIHG